MAFVAFSFGRIQEFIGEARTTADVEAGSVLCSMLSASAARVLSTEAELILPAVPSSSRFSFPNNLWACVRSQRPEEVAAKAAEAALRTWCTLQEVVASEVGVAPRHTPAPPIRWVCVSGDDYADAWERAWSALARRKQISAFEAYSGESGHVCSSCGRLEAALGAVARGGVRLRRGEALCRSCLARRAFPVLRAHLADLLEDGIVPADAGRFPSTAAVATATFRREVLEQWSAEGVHEKARALADKIRQLGETRAGALPALTQIARTIDDPYAKLLAEDDRGLVSADAWSSVTDEVEDVAELEGFVEEGRRAAVELAGAIRCRPAAYLAVVIQDADDLGAKLSGEGECPLGGAPRSVEPGWQREVSAKLLETGAIGYRAIVEDRLGRVVYAGGDDLLAFLPARHALKAAGDCRRRLSEELPGLSASTSVVFFHRSYGLQDALRTARQALEGESKTRAGKDAITIVVLRRGGEKCRVTLPWRRGDEWADQTCSCLVTRFRQGLSPAFNHDLHRERPQLETLDPRFVQQEIDRLLRRHTRRPADSELLARLRRFVGNDLGMLCGALDSTQFIAAEGR